MTHVRVKLGESERRVCSVLGRPRSTQRFAAVPRDGDEDLVRRMHELVRLHPRRGYRMVWGLLRLEGWRVNRKRVPRLWRQEGLRVPCKQHKRTRLRHCANGIARRRAEHANHVWAVDFIHDTDARGRPLKWLSVVDEFTRECVGLKVARSMTARGVADVLIGLFTTRGVPVHIRSDNGPEFIARTIRRLADLTGVQTLHIAPGSPWENGYAESFHSRLRDELLNAEVFADVPDARSLAARRRHEYDHHRPHSSLGYVPPAVSAATLAVPPVGLCPSLRHGQRVLLPSPDSYSTWYRKRRQVSLTASARVGSGSRRSGDRNPHGMREHGPEFP